MNNRKNTINIKELLEAEQVHVQERRKAKGLDTPLEEDSLGIALSGGGIRSATICLGIMERLNAIGVLQKTDYLSSVSGGGYLASYIHSVLNGKNPVSYQDLFSYETIKHLMDYRRYLLLFPNRTFGRIVSYAILGLVGILAVVLNLMWIILPIIYYKIHSTFGWFDFLPNWGHLVVMLVLAALAGLLFCPNFTSPHWFYKFRLQRAYLWKNKFISLKNLNNPKAPYPLINAAVNVNYDNYASTNSVSYRGRIKSNYFLFSPLFCGSQVTRYIATKSKHFCNIKLSTAMATSAAAVNTFMGNYNLPAPLRVLLGVANVRTGILASNPQLKKPPLTWWPKYTFLELFGKASTTTFQIQVSDGGHIENLAVYELLRRNVKTIIVVDAGADKGFNFSDLRNLFVRARNELGIIIEFDKDADPTDIIQPNLTTGFSKNHFAVGKIRGMKGSYSKDYTGVFIYIKSSILPQKEFTLRKQKREAKDLRDRIFASQTTKSKNTNPELEAKYKAQRRTLDRDTYQIYTPNFPHQSTSDQFFDEPQWDAYYYLGKDIGQKLIDDLQWKKEDSNRAIFEKCNSFQKIN